ncbi:hypothetical protein L7F22_055184 [Adiantum nelumboides]|nr:hypothetical protein [Adiantum nelumboides]
MSAAAANKKKNQNNIKDHHSWRKDHVVEAAQEPDTTHKRSGMQPDPGAGAALIQQQQQQNAKGKATTSKSRRRLARGPRSGDQQLAMSGNSGGSASTNGGGVAQAKTSVSNSSAAAAAFPLPSSPHEDHRVVSTHFHDGATQAIMKVTILAAGFVIGARGISARLIGQVTGAVVHSWTERTAGACRSPPPPHHLPPVRLFRIEGKRVSVQAAVALIHEAVSKYKELCECKRRGEFVQRDHVIGGVEFFYHPPPRRALMPPSPPPPPAVRKLPPPPPPPVNVTASSPCPPRPAAPASPHAWKHVMNTPRLPLPAPPAASSQPRLLNFRFQPPAPPPLPGSLIGDSSGPPLPPPHLLPHFRSPPAAPSPIQARPGGGSNSITSMEQSLRRVGLESSQENPSKVDNFLGELGGPSPLKLQYKQHPRQLSAAAGGSPQVQQYCSLFSVFGNGGLPLPIAQVAVAMQKEHQGAALPHVSGSQQLQAASTAFEFTACDFLRESLPLPAFGSARNRGGTVAARRPLAPEPPEYCLFGQHKQLVQSYPSMPLQQLMSSAAAPQPPPLPPPAAAVASAPARPLINALTAVPDLIHWPPLIRSTHVHPQDHSKA